MVFGNQSLGVMPTFLTQKILCCNFQLLLSSIHHKNCLLLSGICFKVYKIEENHYLLQLQPLIQDITCKVEIFG